MRLNFLLSLILISFSFSLSLSSFANSDYYPKEIDNILSHKVLVQKKGFIAYQSDEDLVKKCLSDVLNKFHVAIPGKKDILVNHCGQNDGKGICYTQKVLGYKGARKILFGQIYLNESKEGQMSLTEVYCHKTFTRSNLNLGRNKIPNSDKVNCEHTWPQSKFSTRFPKEMQKSDLHHLFPTTSKANSIRGNLHFADVDVELNQNLCEASHIGLSGNKSQIFFEPPRDHKGNVARALFYFSVRYKIKINDYEESFLRKWDELDPVDENEMIRNNTVNDVQGNRNPFIDFPNLASRISNF